MSLSAEDRFEILQLPIIVAAAMDDRDAQAFTDCWTDDTYFDYNGTIYNSKAEVSSYAEEHMKSDEAKGKRHFALNIRFKEILDDKVTLKSNLLMLEAEQIPSVIATGEIEEELVRTQSGWKFSKRIFRLDPGFQKLMEKWQSGG